MNLLIATSHAGHLPGRDSRQDIALDGGEKGGFTAFATQDVIVQVNQERQVSDTAIVVAISIEDFEERSGVFGFF